MSTPTPPNGPAASDGFRDHHESNHLSLPAFHSVRENSREAPPRTAASNDSGSPSHRSRSRSHNRNGNGNGKGDSERARLLERLSFGSSVKSDHESRSKDKEKENDA